MNTENTPASEQDLQALAAAARKRRLEILVDADNLKALADHFKVMGQAGASTVMARCAATLRELVE